MSGSFVRRFALLVLFTVAMLVAALAAKAQDNEEKLTLTPADKDAALSAHQIYRHARAARTAKGAATLSERPHAASEAGTSVSSTTATVTRDPGHVGYFGGARVDYAESHLIYMLPNGKCNAGCWGNPALFLSDLANSTFIHLVDQYVGLYGSDRYTVGKSLSAPYKPLAAPLTDTDIAAIVHGAAKAMGHSGLHHIFHVLLPPKQDICMDSGDTVCYSPDNPGSFIFCGYHASVSFADLGEVLYTVEPYQDVPGCQVKPGSPNGVRADSTNNTLSHELFETITDPEGDAWWNGASIALYGAEIGDECSFGVSGYFDPAVFTIGSHQYAVQLEYSNARRLCADQ